ncbi:methylhydantoinase [Haematobacter missouriensis]|uniref:Hydantoinase n=1 Tax=Haematobacter missouriensis TaxID=366616 RepID=A0A212AL88_9RHOB|nr:hydantoinase/oxoprolinase family protein [Haematobacter missouriensis]KFI32480.1 methylhydantoinase [Haematobacter missouriensis]OWJ76448.1 hydantoinase [Haematobacter missouriensis]OWJ82280.1 hydantoinase [Haematobacter missouriensis]
MPYSLGIDIGGTFTDLVLFEPQKGVQHNLKVLTTPDRPSEAVIRGAERIIQREGVDPADVNRVVHATTLFTNALIERKGAVTALLTTEGFRDVLEIGRERKFELYDIFIEMPRSLVPRTLRAEVKERMTPRGEVETPIDMESLKAAVESLVAQGATSIAISFLHSYANPAHEDAAAEFIRTAYPNVSVTTSFEVAPEIREYERTSTAVANAYVKPLAGAYLTELETRLKQIGVTAPLFLMVSSGGLTNIDEARRNPIQLLESGPAAGALSAAFFGDRSEVSHVLAFDMGGTTAKLSVVDQGEPLISYKFEAARTRRFKEGSGLPIKISTIELIEIGAGGGSIAHIDKMGLMKVGPESASSKPGPACYGLGGELPTVTDANLTLGYLNPDFFAGGTMNVDPKAAASALGSLSDATGLSVAELAWGVHDIVNENMASAARVHIAERGKDTRRYALVTTGGGGPLHGYQVARKLGLGRLVCPPGAGVASALGLLIAPARVDRVATVARPVAEVDWSALELTFERLEAEGRAVVTETVPQAEAINVRRLADMRYIGQGFELVVELPEGPYSAASMEPVLAAFRAAYREVFTLNPPTDRIEIVNVRITVSAETGSARMARQTDGADPETAVKQRRQIYFPELRDFTETPVYDRIMLPGGIDIHGPAVIEEPESTLVVGPEGSFRVEPNGNIVVTIAN